MLCRTVSKDSDTEYIAKQSYIFLSIFSHLPQAFPKTRKRYKQHSISRQKFSKAYGRLQTIHQPHKSPPPPIMRKSMKSPMKWSKTEPPKKRLTSPIVRIRSAERDNGMRKPLAAQCLQIFPQCLQKNLQALRREKKAATKNSEGVKELFRVPKHIVPRLDKFMPRLQKEESAARKSMKNMCF